MQECAAHRDTRHVRRAVKWATCRREFSHPIDRRKTEMRQIPWYLTLYPP